MHFDNWCIPQREEKNAVQIPHSVRDDDLVQGWDWDTPFGKPV